MSNKHLNLFRELLNDSLEAILFLDTHHTIQEVNTTAEDLFEYERNELLKQPISLIIPHFPFSLHAVCEKELLTQEKGHFFKCKHSLHGLKKSTKHFSLELSVKSILVDQKPLVVLSIRDAESQQFLQTQLEASEHRFRSLLDNTMDMLLLTDDKGNILSCNKACERTLGYERAFIEGKNIELFIADEKKGVVEQIIQYKNFGRYHEISCQRHNSQVFPAEISIAYLDTKNKDRSTLLWILRDITEREQLGRMQADFVSIISHELRTPLTSIRGAIGLMLLGKGGVLTSEMKHLIELAQRNTERLVVLVNDILDIEKVEAGKMTFIMETIDLVQLIPQIIQADKPYAEQFQTQLEAEIPFNKLLVVSDKQRLYQALSNLLSNAIKFSHPQGKVKVKLEKIDKKVRISVIDQGIGIPKEFHSKVFQRFAQAETSTVRQTAGTGLGLSICKMIVEKLGGTIHFTSEYGKGSTFYIEMDSL